VPGASPMSVAEQVREFHRATGLPTRIAPTIPLDDEQELRRALIYEELKELVVAQHEHDIVGIADALGDLAYVVYGAAEHYGLDLDLIVSEIHRSNMTKVCPDGSVKVREDGKIEKGPNYRPPDIQRAINYGAALRDPS
jgi:predicted HAD superfamily Cof-like phosphohydrolase